MPHTKIGRAFVVSVALVLMTGISAFAQEPSTAEQTIDVMNKLFGKHPGFRANHAKGVVAEGSFTPSAEAAKISKASFSKGRPCP